MLGDDPKRIAAMSGAITTLNNSQVTKTLVVLANSYKHDPGRCIAGREVTFTPGGTLGPKNWVRPVSENGEGELQPADFKLEDGSLASVMDVVDIPLRAKQSDPTQPENWYIAEKSTWSRVSSVDVDDLLQFVESPTNLWLEPKERTNRISVDYLRQHLPSQSLYLLSPDECSVRRNEFDTLKFRLHFSHNGSKYNLAITDPQLLDQLPSRMLGRNELPFKQVITCVSLTPPFSGHHYKVAAMVIQPLSQRSLYTIGHSNRSLEEFVNLLSRFGIEAVADVRSQPHSARLPHFSKPELHASLRNAGIEYVFLGKELGARRDEPQVYVGGQAKYDRIANCRAFHNGIRRVIDGSKRFTIALMCAEKDPLTCHRTILVSRHLQDYGYNIIHIVDSDHSETHQGAELRLMTEEGLDPNQISFSGQEFDHGTALSRAYESRSNKIAFRRGEEVDEDLHDWIHAKDG